MIGLIVGGVMIIFALFLSCFRVAREWERAVILRMGKYKKTKGPGLYWMTPFLDKRVRLDIRVNNQEVDYQECITKDSVIIKINAFIFYRIVEPHNVVIKVNDYKNSLIQLLYASMRNIISRYYLDEILKLKDKVNDHVKENMEKICKSWGISIELFEIKDIEIPESVKKAMLLAAEAVREKRAQIIKAEAESAATDKLLDASKNISENPNILELRRIQMITELGEKNNPSTLIFIPSDLTAAVSEIAKLMKNK